MQADFDRNWETASKAVLTGMKAWRLAHAQATLTEIEEELDRRLRRLRVELLTDLAAASPLRDISALPEAERPVCPHCGHRVKPRGTQVRQLLTAGNELVVLHRSYGVCPQCQAGFFPPG